MYTLRDIADCGVADVFKDVPRDRGAVDVHDSLCWVGSWDDWGQQERKVGFLHELVER